MNTDLHSCSSLSYLLLLVLATAIILIILNIRLRLVRTFSLLFRTISFSLLRASALLLLASGRGLALAIWLLAPILRFLLNKDILIILLNAIY